MIQNQPELTQETTVGPTDHSLLRQEPADNSVIAEETVSVVTKAVPSDIPSLDRPRVHHSLVHEINTILDFVDTYKERAKDFYFQVLLSQRSCPTCGKELHMTGISECSCRSGHIFDPTIVFQLSDCCRARLVRKTFHYSCSGCQRTVPSQFLFDERVFDADYFREMMREHRERTKSRREEIGRLLAGSRSGALLLLEEPCMEALPDFLQDMEAFIRGNPIATFDYPFEPKSEFDLDAYRTHILSLLGHSMLRFSDVSPLTGDDRRDRARRFIALVFMDNDREISLEQYGDDLLIRRGNDEAYTEG